MAKPTEYSLKDRVAIVTGCSSGIGEAIAKALAAEGAKVMMGARRVDKLKALKASIESFNGISEFKSCDVTKRSDVKELVAFAETTFGPVDILINNAGVMPLSWMKNCREDEWEQMVDVNIKGVLNGVGAVLNSMLSRKTGDIVNISSDAGRKLFPTGTVYCATKWAVEAITQGLRVENAGKGLRFLSIQPGATYSELGTNIKDPEVGGPPDIRFLDADDIARAVIFALKQPRHASINEILIRPEAQGF